MRPGLCLLLLLGLGTTVAAANEHTISVRNAHVQEAPPGVSPLAGYLTLANTGKETVELIGATSPDFERIEIHESRIEGDVAKMRRKQSLTLTADQIIVFEPGGYHLMLFKPVRPLRAGDKTSLTLQFKNKPPLSVTAPVRSLRGEPAMDHSHHH